MSLPLADPIRTDRPNRAAALPTPMRKLHGQILRHFAATGTAPTTDDLTHYATAAGVDTVPAMRTPAEHDLVAVDAADRLIAAYPFSPTPTGHQVHIGAVTVSAMCAIDALGIPAMLDIDATIDSADPHSGAPISVTFAGGAATFDPPSTVVVYAATGQQGPSVDTCCSIINFFTSHDTASVWIANHPGLQTRILNQPDAIALADTIFGPLITGDSHAR